MGDPRQGKGRLVLAGFGMDLRQMTLETVEAIKSCGVLCTDALDEASLGPLRAYCSDIRILDGGGKDGPPAAASARKVAAVLDRLAEGREVVVLNYGHATFLSSLAYDLIEACRERGIPYEVLNSVSSLDGVLASLGMTMLWSGLHIYDADDFAGLMTVVPLNPEVPTIIVKVGYLLKPHQMASLDSFLSRLGASYPLEHPVTLVVSPWVSEPAGKLVTVPLRDLKAALAGPNEFVTLFVPPLRARGREPVVGAALAGELEEGCRLMAKGDAAAAEAFFDGLVKRSPDWVQALAWRACCRLAAARVSEALQDLDRCAALRPEPEWHFQLRAQARLEAGDPRGALADLEKAELWPHHRDLTALLRARASARTGDWVGALKAAARVPPRLWLNRP
ncbi:MAG: hypothetical protein HY928_09805 [Elusimicrobia bacterium]|nr:hypothetical protein [Elusimicrobiota bacterium]